jgi:hypothetical protein
MPKNTSRVSDTTEKQDPDGTFNVEEIVGQMETRSSDKAFLEKACLVVCENLDFEYGTSAQIDTTPMLATLIRLLKAYPKVQGLQGNLMAIILRFLKGNIPNKNMFLRENGAELVLGAMTRFSHCVYVQGNACHLIHTLKEDMISLRQETTRPMLKAMLAAMSKQMPGYRDQKPAAQAANAAGKKGMRSSDTADASPTVIAYVCISSNGLSNFGDDVVMMQKASLLKHCIEAFGDLRSEMDQSIAESAIIMISKAMRAFPMDVFLQAYGCETLAGLAMGGGRNVLIMWEEGGFATMLAGMSIVLEWRNQGNTSINTQMLMSKCCHVIYLLYNTDVQDTQTGLTIVSQIIVSHMTAVDVLLQACQALAKACEINKENRQLVGRRAVRALLLVLSKHAANGSLLTRAFCALASVLCEVQTNCECAMEKDGLRIVLRQSQRHMDECELQVNAVLTLVIIGEYNIPTIPVMLEAGVLQHIIKVMKHHAGHEHCQRVAACGCAAITQMINGCASIGTSATQSLITIVHEGGPDMLVDCIPLLYQVNPSSLCKTMDQLRNLLVLFRKNVLIFGIRAIRPAVNLLAHTVSAGARGLTKTNAGLMIIGCSLLAEIMDSGAKMSCLRIVQDEFGQCGGFKVISQCLHICSDEEALQIYGQALRCPNLVGALLTEALLLPSTAFVTLHMALQDNIHNQCLFIEDSAGIAATIRGIMTKCSDIPHILKHAGILLNSIAEMGGTDVLADDNIAAASESTVPPASARGERVFGLVNLAAAAVEQPDATGHASQRSAKGSDACAACGKTAADAGVAKLLKCSACTIAPLYCSAACQKACWKAHKADCKANKKANV